MEDLLGCSVAVYIGVTVCLFGLAAFLMGQALANTWRSSVYVIVYSAFLTVGDRFLVFALFGAPGFSLSGYLTHWATLAVIAGLAYRLTRAHKMVAQYPWLYERAGLLSWREKS